MKHIIPVSLGLCMAIAPLIAIAQSVPTSFEQGYPAPVTLMSPSQPTQSNQVVQPAFMLPTRAIREPAGLVTIRPPEYPPGVYPQPANTCFVAHWQYPEADLDNDGHLEWSELSQFCRKLR